MIEQSPAQRYLHWVQNEILKQKEMIDELKKSHPEKSEEEIINELVEKELTTSILTENGARLIFKPLDQFKNVKIPSDEIVLDAAAESIEFYNQKFNKLFDISKNYSQFGEEIFKSSEEFIAQAMLNTDLQKLKNVFFQLLERYLSELVQEKIAPVDFKIDEWHKLEPDELILLINGVLIKHFRYDNEIAQKYDVSKASNILSLDTLLEQGNGVCRHYAELSSIIYEQLKRDDRLIQRNDFKHTFLLYVSDDAMNHAYNASVKILPNGDFALTISDPTWTKDIKDAPLNLDYTRERKTHIIKHHIIDSILPTKMNIKTKEKEQIQESDKLLQLFDKYYDYLKKEQFSSYEEFADFVRVALLAPINAGDVFRYSMIINKSIVFLDKNQQDKNPIAMEDQKQIEELIKLFLASLPDAASLKPYNLLKKGILKKGQKSLFQSWISTKGKEAENLDKLMQNFTEHSIRPEILYDIPIMKDLLLAQNTLNIERIKEWDNYFSELFKTWDIKTKENYVNKADVIKQQIDNILKPSLDILRSCAVLKNDLPPLINEENHYINYLDKCEDENSNVKDKYKVISSLPTISVFSRDKQKNVALLPEIIAQLEEVNKLKQDIFMKFNNAFAANLDLSEPLSISVGENSDLNKFLERFNETLKAISEFPQLLEAHEERIKPLKKIFESHFSEWNKVVFQEKDEEAMIRQIYEILNDVFDDIISLMREKMEDSDFYLNQCFDETSSRLTIFLKYIFFHYSGYSDKNNYDCYYGFEDMPKKFSETKDIIQDRLGLKNDKGDFRIFLNNFFYILKQKKEQEVTLKRAVEELKNGKAKKLLLSLI